MIQIRNALSPEGQTVSFEVPSQHNQILDASGLTVLPALIDPHVHFRAPGNDHKENWVSGAKAAIRGGYTTVLDMPNNTPACITPKRLDAKIAQIEEQLKIAEIPLRYGLYFGADRNHFHHLPQVRDRVIGVKIFMGSSTGDLLMDDESSLHAAFAICAKLNLTVAIHAEDECEIQSQIARYQNEKDPAIHSKIRSPEAAAKAVKLAIELVRLYGTKLYILHVSTHQELLLIESAKKEGLPVFAEACPHHLFLNDSAYSKLGTLAQMNPPLRSSEDQAALLEGITRGIIDTIGSDHAPHTLAEKNQPYGKAPSGVPGIETTLRLLLNAYHQSQLTLSDIIRLTHEGPRTLFNLPKYSDIVLVDLKAERSVFSKHLQTKCAWSPFENWTLKGCPKYVILDKVYDIDPGQ